jgi:UDP-N-acetylglucosamine 2-epimerase (non-hydrolysing)
MEENQSLALLTSKIIFEFSKLLTNFAPDIVIVHGDTTTSFACALSAFYKGIKVAHVEAGLRTNDLSQPFPEEANRQLTARIASYHFAPTILNYNNLVCENVLGDIWVTGNTIVDALSEIIDREMNYECPFDIVKERFILVTAHRRENFGNGFENICDALLKIANDYKDVKIVFPVHLNPNVKKIVNEKLSNIDNIYLIDPLPYNDFIRLLCRCEFVITDSGGIQEECASIKKNILVLRESTERPDVLKGKLVGTDVDKIYKESSSLLDNEEKAKFPYPSGDTEASSQIYKILKEKLG